MDISHDDFMKMPASDVAAILRNAGGRVCIFPINGTRRWFALEYGDKMDAYADPMTAYMDIAGREHIRIYKLFFDFGVDTLVTPAFGGEILTRAEAYTRRVVGEGLARFATHPDFLAFYTQYKVRVRFYGDYRRKLANTEFDYLIGMFDRVTELTRNHDRYRLFYGIFGDDATESVSDFSVRYFHKNGKIPSKKEIVESYYGEFVDKANIFIGFDRPWVFDYPLLGWGNEDLYFTAAPSLYLNENHLREILYDHLHTRRVEEPEYSEMSPEDFGFMKQLYADHRNTIFGVGKLRGDTWYPGMFIE